MCIADLRSFHAGTFIERVLIYDGYYLNTSNPTPLESRPVFFIPGGESFVEGGYEHNGTCVLLLHFSIHRFFDRLAGQV